MLKSQSKNKTNALKGILIVLVIIYMTWTIGLSIQRNYKTNEQIDGLKKEIAILEVEINELKNLTYYYQTDGFKEVEARRRLGLKAAGEQVIILPKRQESPTPNAEDKPQETKESSDSNFSRWWQFVFGAK